MEKMGIDVSHYQKAIDWNMVKKSGVDFAIMKCMYEAKSHRIDETFEANYRNAGAMGIARGVYIFIASASIADPQGDANALLKHLNGRSLEYGIWLDLESSVLRSQGKNKIKELAYIYAGIFRAAGYYCGIYCNKDWYDNVIHPDLKKDFEFWIARYPRNDVGEYNPRSSLKPAYTTAVAWQYSSKGKVPGITGNVDLDVDYDGIIKLFASEGKITYKPITPKLIESVIAGNYGNGAAREKAITNEGYNYSEVRKKINDLNKIGQSFLPEIKNKAGDYWLSVVRLMGL